MHAEEIRRLARNERLARLAGFWWGFAEGLVFFIVPDIYISFATLFAFRAGATAWLSSIAGSLVAVATIYLLAITLGLDYLSFLYLIPGISGGMIEGVGRSLAVEGLPYTPLLVLGGVPLKVYAGVGYSLGLSLGSVLLWTLFARILRIAPTFALVGAIRLLLHRRIDERAKAWCLLLGCFWVVFYIFYFVRMSRT